MRWGRLWSGGLLLGWICGGNQTKPLLGMEMDQMVEYVFGYVMLCTFSSLVTYLLLSKLMFVYSIKGREDHQMDTLENIPKKKFEPF
jgi:hypothetical protein